MFTTSTPSGLKLLQLSREKTNHLRNAVPDLAIGKAPLTDANAIRIKKITSISLVATAKAIIEGSAYTKTSVCRALGISRGAIHKLFRINNIAFYRKAGADNYLPTIRQVIEKRPTYGSRNSARQSHSPRRSMSRDKSKTCVWPQEEEWPNFA
ncbi:MAG: hypothetical protein EOO45_00065 [Flavobacterium sp.]|nr:MAG: hypothetical protein EOO45_00065 [Flavobacterium sp.]